jgi:hypothetical protein
VWEEKMVVISVLLGRQDQDLLNEHMSYKMTIRIKRRNAKFSKIPPFKSKPGISFQARAK